MNYIAEINSFNDWLETNDVPKSAVALWYALMHVNNKSNWKKTFAVAVSVLEFKTKFKRSELFKARNILAQKERITWESRGGNSSSVYSIIPFSSDYCVHNTDANGNASGNANGNTNTTQMGTINKLNKTKLNNNSPPTPHSGGEGMNNSFEDKMGEDKKCPPEIVEPPGKRKKVAQKKEKPPLNFDFVADDGFRAPFLRFIDYRKSIKKPYRSQQGVEGCYRELLEYSGGDPTIAEKIVAQSIANEWQGIFKLKNNNNERNYQPNKTTESERRRREREEFSVGLATLLSQPSGQEN
jgi:hypothetical protein